MIETLDTGVVLAAEAAAESPMLEDFGAAAVGLGLAALAAGYAERGIGSAAVGAMAEDRDMFVPGLIMTVLPETILIFAFIAVLLAL